MNETEHVFPLPDAVQHKLDEVKDEVVHPIARRARRTLSENVWKALAISVAAGVVCGLMLKRRG